MELVYLFFLPVFFLDPFQNGMKTLLWKKTINILIFWLINFFHSFIFNLGFHHHFFKFLNHDKISMMISLVKKNLTQGSIIRPLWTYIGFVWAVHFFFYSSFVCVCLLLSDFFFIVILFRPFYVCVCVYNKCPKFILYWFCFFFLFKFLSWSKKYSDFFFFTNKTCNCFFKYQFLAIFSLFFFN